MEIVLLWLDDLDDAILVGAVLLEKWRIVFLDIGLLAAVGLHGSKWLPGLPLPEEALASAALACVAVWVFGSLARQAQVRARPKVSLPA
jgi:hypothetical protein